MAKMFKRRRNNIRLSENYLLELSSISLINIMLLKIVIEIASITVATMT